MHETNRTFQGALLDTGASVSVIGREQTVTYCEELGIPFVIELNVQKFFKFGSQERQKTKIHYATGRTMELDIDIFDVNITLLFGLDTPDEHKLYINNVENVLVSTDPSYEHPITKKFRHLFSEWDDDVLYTDSELRCIYRHFYHTHQDKV